MASPPVTYDFFTPPRIVFGWGRRKQLGPIAADLGRRAFIISGSKTLTASGALDELRQSLAAANVAAEMLGTISREPQAVDVDQFTARVCHERPTDGDFVLAVGGGSAIDLGKAVAAMATNRASPTVRDYLEGVGSGLKITSAPLPVLAMPTTAGTGSEATKNAVISNQDPPFKKSLRSDMMVPRAVLIDPELTVSVPPQTTAYTGMDAITQLIESYISRRSKLIPNALALQGIRLAIPTVMVVYREGSLHFAREMMAHAALLSGMALANSGLGMAHAVAAALGVHCGVPHGLACAVMLPAALRANRDVARAGLADLGRTVNDDPPIQDIDKAADDFIDQIDVICSELGIPKRLSEIGVEPRHLPDLVRGSHGNSMSGNPREISDDELYSILERML
ncbi:MAG: iron-containing alcohol dehydrogenase [Pirellulales bacterium]